MEMQQLESKIGQKVKIIFKERDQRYPMIGKLVAMTDHKSLTSKGMVRFVNQTKLDYWDDTNPSVGLTKIYVVKDFSQVLSVK